MLRRRLVLLALALTAPIVAACHMPTAADDPGAGGAADTTHRDIKPWG